MTAVGLIFSNIHDNNIPELTKMRTLGSVPFGGRYRLVDFALSSMVNSGISKIGIVTHNNYQSLIDHLGNGEEITCNSVIGAAEFYKVIGKSELIFKRRQLVFRFFDDMAYTLTSKPTAFGDLGE